MGISRRWNASIVCSTRQRFPFNRTSDYTTRPMRGKVNPRARRGLPNVRLEPLLPRFLSMQQVIWHWNERSVLRFHSPDIKTLQVEREGVRRARLMGVSFHRQVRCAASGKSFRTPVAHRLQPSACVPHGAENHEREHEREIVDLALPSGCSGLMPCSDHVRRSSNDFRLVHCASIANG